MTGTPPLTSALALVLTCQRLSIQYILHSNHFASLSNNVASCISLVHSYAGSTATCLDGLRSSWMVILLYIKLSFLVSLKAPHTHDQPPIVHCLRESTRQLAPGSEYATLPCFSCDHHTKLNASLQKTLPPALSIIVCSTLIHKVDWSDHHHA